jgi:FAD/FMN-containing dehydrogenase
MTGIMSESGQSAWRLAAELPAASISALAQRIAGYVLLPSDPDWESARKVWNGTVERRPGMIVKCLSAADVAATVRFGRQHSLLTSVRGGGHGVAGHAVCDGGLVVDLSDLHGVEVTPSARACRVEGGATWERFDVQAAGFGLATTGGQISTTGVAGLTLGGGLGWLMRSFGATVDNLLSVSLVTSVGEQVTASEHENSDLFWALRGGGGNFGIATSMEFRLHPVDRVLGGTIFWPASQAAEVMAFYKALTDEAPPELSLMTYFVPLLRAPFIPPELADAPMVAIAVCSLDQQQWEPITARLRGFGRPAGDSLAVMPYPQLQAMFDRTAPFGMNAYWRSCYLRELSQQALATIERFAASTPSPVSQILITHMGGALASAPAAGTSFGHRDAAHVLEIIAKWTEGPVDPHAAWADAFLAAMQPFATGGVYVNFLGDEGPARIAAAYEPESLARLATIKARYDPDNYFFFNQNIAPATRQLGRGRAVLAQGEQRHCARGGGGLGDHR